MNNLAIVIPAYKATYLKETLESIAKQIDKRFNLYVGDDCSPYDIESIIMEYKSIIPITYKRFEENLGGKDLVAQWERCIDLTNGEEWIWLFSDDDIMAPTCVEDFYRELNKCNNFDIYRFDVTVINNNDCILGHIKYPKTISSQSLYTEKIAGHLECFVVEYIFKRSVYLNYNGFVKFDLAWGSDLATWVNFGERTDIATIDSPGISWRSSGMNISTDFKPDILKRKVTALVDCLKWGESKYSDSVVREVNKKGLISRLSSIGVSSSFRIGYTGVLSYTENVIERIYLSLRYCIYYLYKKFRNVF